MPPEPNDKGSPAPGLLSHVIVSEFADHLPLYPQEKIIARSGLGLSRSTLCDWLASCAEQLRPMYSLMVKLVLESTVIHMDDTPVWLLHPDGPQTGRVWVYLGAALHSDTRNVAMANRSGDGPEMFLHGFKGYLQADAFGGYDGIYARGVTEVACWAHARRKFMEAENTDAVLAAERIARIRFLYDIEDRARKLSAAEQAVTRQRETVPVLQSLRHWLDELQRRILPNSPLGQAIRYVRNQLAALCVFVADGDLAIDNNEAERALLGTALS